MPDFRTFQEKVRDFIEENRLLPPGMAVVVGVSGGADSIALLHVLRALAPGYGLRLHVAHLNHLLRPDARKEAAFVQKLARNWGIPVTVGYYRVARLAALRKLGIEEAARQARYRFLFHVARRVSAGRIALGHHAGDRVETVIFNIMRGTGPAGLSGIPARREYIIRPLLGVTKEEIEAYCRDCGLTWLTDPSNLETLYLRNKIRHELLPYLRREFNPNVDRAILRLADIMQEENRFLEKLSESLLQDFARRGKLGEVQFPLPAFLQLPLALRRRVLRTAARTAVGGLRDMGYDHLEDCLAFLAKGPIGGEIHLPHGIRLRKSYGLFTIGQVSETVAELKEVLDKLEIPGKTEVPALGLIFHAQIWARDRESKNGFICSRPGRYQAFFDYDKIKLPLYVRTRRPGDRIRLLGLGGTKKIKNLYSDLKIPRRERERIPLVASDGLIYWVVGYRRSEEAQVTSQTRLILELRASKEIEER
ncbi:MAG: tRNA lysidine(34) synthetase TilS [Bacillota bacterium]|nr:tRNA lysidine(34) synthetase TilS [Bacillota bacterium]